MQVRELRVIFDTVREITNLNKLSQKINAIFDKLKARLAPDTPGFRVLCSCTGE